MHLDERNAERPQMVTGGDSTVTEDANIQVLRSPEGNTTLRIENGQAVQGWESELMEESARLLCSYGSEFLEVGLGFGFSALAIARHPNTSRHVVLEKHAQVIEMFREGVSELPSTLEIRHADFFSVVSELPSESFDGIFFDPALPMSVWRDQRLWDEVVPKLVKVLRNGGVLIPFFSTRPVLRQQYLPYFSRIVVERRQYEAYEDTVYTRGTSGDAYIQCFIKDGPSAVTI